MRLEKTGTIIFIIAISTFVWIDVSIASVDKCRKPFYLKIGDKVSMKFCKIPAPQRAVWMGSKSGAEDERPLALQLFNSFQIGQFEVTQSQYKEITGESPWENNDANLSEIKIGDDVPATNMSYDDTIKFFKALNETDKCAEYRLPTASEWEYAARGKAAIGLEDLQDRYWEPAPASDFAFYFQENMVNVEEPRSPAEVQVCPNAKQNSNQPGYCANNFGLYHMLGNVWEFTSTRSLRGLIPNDKMPLNGNTVVDFDLVDNAFFDKGKTIYAEVRGGGANTELIFVRASTRAAMSTKEHTKYVGFRVVRIPKLGVKCDPSIFTDEKFGNLENEISETKEKAPLVKPKYDVIF